MDVAAFQLAVGLGGLTRPEIVGELSVSPNTVGAHIRSIYAKLQVRDRTSAVRRARELRLLRPVPARA